MKYFVRFLFLFTFFFGLKNSKASHIIGGELTYICTENPSGNTYAFELILYRDCLNGAVGFNPMVFNFFNTETNVAVKTSEAVVADLIEELDFSETDPCVDFPTDVCIEKAIYSFVTTLPPSLDGYTVVTGVCCLASNVQNIFDATNQGIIATTTIPPLGGGNPHCFNSPVFNTDPVAYLCLYDVLDEDFGAHLPTPDPTITLLHSFYTPEWEFAGTPPLDLMSFEPGYSFDQPVSSVSGMNLDPYTGQLTGIIDEIGFFYIGVKVYAVKNGDTIATISRPFRYNVSDCNINRSEPGLTSPIECGDLNISFSNFSVGADDYEWNFGDPTTGNQNVSASVSPSHTFSSFGDYEVTLITLVNNDTNCSDTNYLQISIDSAVTSSIGVNNDYQCIAANSFKFNADSEGPGVTYEWDFGPSASITSSSSTSVNNVKYSSVGIYPVTLKTFYKECVSETSINVEVFDGLLSEITGPTEGCAPFDAVFKPSIIKPGYTFTWSSNGRDKVSTNGEFTYHNPGLYTVALHVRDNEGCESTHILEDYIEIFEVPETGFTISDNKISVGDIVKIENEVHGDYKIEFLVNTVPEIKEVVTKSNFGFTMYKEGNYLVTQTVTNNDICVSQETKIINVGPPRVNPPNVFTPNTDGVNDFFYIEPYNNSNIEFKVFDRWGLEVYSSDNYEQCNPETGEFCWNGTDREGNECIHGIYFYSIQLENGFVKQGTLNLF